MQPIANCPQSVLRAVAVLAAALVPAVAPAQEIRVGGTGGPLATVQMLAEAYRKSEPAAKITVLPSLGSSGGIKAVLAGAIQVAVSSRPLKPDETKRGAAVAFDAGRTPFAFAVPSKTAVDAVTTQDLVDLYSGNRERWRDGARIRVILRPVGDSDSDMVRGISPEVKQAKMIAEKRPGMLFAVTDQEAADAIEKTIGAFGTTTLAQVVSERRAIKLLRFNGVEPTARAVADGSYPLSKPLYFVTGPGVPPAAQKFLAFVRSPAGREILARAGHALPRARPRR